MRTRPRKVRWRRASGLRSTAAPSFFQRSVAEVCLFALTSDEAGVPQTVSSSTPPVAAAASPSDHAKAGASSSSETCTSPKLSVL